MSGDAVKWLLVAFDDAWAHDFESFSSATEGVSEMTWGWQSSAYRDAPAEDGAPPAGTIAWHVDHLTVCHREYATMLRRARDADDASTVPPTPPPGSGTLVAMARLDAATAALRAEIKALDDTQLDTACTSNLSVGAYIIMFTRHLTWHAAQIRLLRRLASADNPTT